MSQASSEIPDDWVVIPADEEWVLMEPETEGPTVMHVLGHGARGVGVVGLEALKGLGSGVSTELPHEEKIAGAANTLGVCTGATVRFIVVTGCSFVSGLMEGITSEPEENKK